MTREQITDSILRAVSTDQQTVWYYLSPTGKVYYCFNRTSCGRMEPFYYVRISRLEGGFDVVREVSKVVSAMRQARAQHFILG